MPTLRYSHLLVAFLFSILLASLFSSFAGSSNQGSQTRYQIRDIEARQLSSRCEYKGNSDLYGFGIRLGLYLQWTASVISKAWTPSLDSIRDLLDADAIFLLAIFVATSVYSTGVLEPVHDIDVLILLHMFFGDVYSVMFEIAMKDRKVTPMSAMGTRCRMLVIAGMSAYAVWFWFIGIETLSSVPCGSVAFLFAKVALRGKVKIFFQVVSALNLFFWGVFGILALMAFPYDPYQHYLMKQTIQKTRWWKFNRDHGENDVRRTMGRALMNLTGAHSQAHSMVFHTPEFWRILKENHRFVWRMLTAVASADGYHKQYKGKTRHDLRIGQIYLLVNILIALFTIVAIELIIRWNHISNVYSLGSTSQIIPLVIGVGNLWKVVLSLLNEILVDSSWNPNHQVFQLRDGKWKSFPIYKPERRLSSTGALSTDDNEIRAKLAQTLSEDYKEWAITANRSTNAPESSDLEEKPEKEYLGIASHDNFLLSMASDSRRPSNADLTRFVADLYAFAQSKRLTVLAILTKFENDLGNGYQRRELLLWPLTSQAASKLSQLRKIEDDPDFYWRFWKKDLYRGKLGLAEWDDAKYDPDHVVDRQKPVKKARMSDSLTFNEETFAEESTWRRVWSLERIERKGANLERIAEYLVGLLKQS